MLGELPALTTAAKQATPRTAPRFFMISGLKICVLFLTASFKTKYTLETPRGPRSSLGDGRWINAVRIFVHLNFIHWTGGRGTGWRIHARGELNARSTRDDIRSQEATNLSKRAGACAGRMGSRMNWSSERIAVYCSRCFDFEYLSWRILFYSCRGWLPLFIFQWTAKHRLSLYSLEMRI